MIRYAAAATVAAGCLIALTPAHAATIFVSNEKDNTSPFSTARR